MSAAGVIGGTGIASGSTLVAPSAGNALVSPGFVVVGAITSCTRPIYTMKNCLGVWFWRSGCCFRLFYRFCGYHNDLFIRYFCSLWFCNGRLFYDRGVFLIVIVRFRSEEHTSELQS